MVKNCSFADNTAPSIYSYNSLVKLIQINAYQTQSNLRRPDIGFLEAAAGSEVLIQQSRFGSIASARAAILFSHGGSTLNFS